MATVLPIPIWRRALTSGISQVALTMLAANAARIISSVVLTRILSPDDYGVVGVTSTIVMIMFMVSDVGFGVYIVQHAQGDDPRRLDAIWTVRLLRSLGLTALLAAAAWPLSTLLQKPDLAPVIAATSLQFLLEGCSSLAPLTAVRKQKLGRLSTLDITASLSQTAFGILLAFVFRNFWAIVIANLLGATLRVVLSYVLFGKARRKLLFDPKEARALWRFGRTIAGTQTIQVFLGNIDRLVLFRVFPLNVFGLYTLASNLAGAPAMFTSIYPNRVLLPAFAKAHRETPECLAREYYRSRRLTMLAYMAAMGGFIGMAPAIVNLLYDPRYEGAGTYLRILAIAPALSLNNYAAREALIVVGRMSSLLIANLVRLLWLLPAGLIGFLAFGPIGLVVAVGLTEVPVLIYSWYALSASKLFRLNEELLMISAIILGVFLGIIFNDIYQFMLIDWHNLFIKSKSLLKYR